ncbi:MAG: DUF2089 domain-containing protein [candidate division Zixibacteria bacterium]|nr:DUF2089 domain-containing protein [candidate division Zixibacteria bacterium]MDH3936710.1 DUF2089 domain-containing protein [candidate division Zixibacteria bacterium]MDH4032563.1 DUF2089 domain-containing protein [candidate division Zixibacteria bacterium]
MKKDWEYLTRITGNRPLTVQRVAIDGENVAVEGQFDLPPLARLKADDQVFVAVFVKCHGSIKQMEKHFGISYPTVKGRLNRISERLDFVEVETVDEPAGSSSVLEQLERGEIAVEDAIEQLSGGGTDE